MRHPLPILSLLVALATACGGTRQATVAPSGGGHGEPGDHTQASDQRARVMRLFMDATQARLNGQPGKATALFEQCIKLDPGNHAAMFELAKLMHMQQRPAEALTWAKKAQAADPENIWYRFLLADLYGQYGQLDKASETFQGIVDKWPERHEVRFQLAHTLAMDGRTDEARKVFKDIRTHLGSGEEVVTQEYGMLANAGELQEAREVLETALKDDPDNVAYLGLLAELYDEMGEGDKALELYRRVLEADPDDSMTRLALAEHYYAKGEMDPAFEQLGLAFGDPDLEVDPKMQVLLGFFEMTTSGSGATDDSKDLVRRAYTLIDILERTHPESGKPSTIRGDFLMRDGRMAEARDAFRKALNYEKDKFPIWMQVLQMDLQAADHATLRDDARAATELFPTSPEPWLYLGIAEAQLKAYDPAIEALVTGRDLVVDNDPLLASFWTSLGDAYHSAGRHDRSDEAFDQALRLDPRNATTLNNYAYYLSLRGEKLERAREMSEQSNKLAPGQTSFEDTYAWVLHRMGRHDEARTWIEKALASGGATSGEVVEHYGDILYALGDQAGAVEQWRKALALGGASEAIGSKASSGRPAE
ncbi:MAG TPA: tetratricopeptide repeat protein [Flavobacteriales bacterium]|nr:tetratricopeptide repeat protein [Flavobacteriales bacterium]HMR29113.1 tetratricopeptide repeat protein [Flavobacteriales bacterium]